MLVSSSTEGAEVTFSTDIFEFVVELNRSWEDVGVNENPSRLCEMSFVLMGWRGRNGGGVTLEKSRTVPRPNVKMLERVVLSVRWG